MLDIRLIREHSNFVKEAIAHKGFDPDIVDRILPVDEEYRDLQTQVESLRAERNKVAALGKEAAERGREIKEELNQLENRLANVTTLLHDYLLQVPNIPAEGVPIGPGESANRVIRTVGEKLMFENPLDHMQLLLKNDCVDQERAVKVASSRFNFLKNEVVLIEFALIRMVMDMAIKHEYIPLRVPELVNRKTVFGTGYLPYGEEEVYKTQDDLYLLGTSEMAIVGMHQDEILDELPLRYIGFSSCFRREAGSYGKDTAGILRQHQFDKVELVSFVKPEHSTAELDKILAIEEEIMEKLGLPYQVVEIGTGDLGVQAARKYDIETWMPGQNKYRETHSCSNTTDFQSRRLNIRYRKDDGKTEFVHVLNGTAIAIGRMLIAIFENGQQKDGTVVLPPELALYVGFSEVR